MLLRMPNIYILVLISLVWSCSNPIPIEFQTELAALPSKVDYNQHVKPILSDKCFACHGPDSKKQKAGLRLDLEESAFGELPDSRGKVAIDPGDLDDSEVFKRIISTDPEFVMPTPSSHLKLSNYEKAVLIKWIKDGAKYEKHWAFVKPEMPEIPEVKNQIWVRNPIDNFILKKLEEKNLKPSKIADKETLLRRLYFDLTGLPPSVVDINRFKADNGPRAYEKEINKLLASTSFGERMAVDWLDVARFADSHGYTVDRLRDMSPYRDWVIDAFNKNIPFSQFITWQIAGDMMKKPSKEMLIATAFNRNHPQNMEGGIIEEEFQTEYVIDRTNTLGEAFLGLSMGCAKCHDHKYDPISQKNYYEMFSFFNNVKEAGQIAWDDTPPSPTIQLPTKKQEEIIEYLNKEIKKAEQIGIKEKSGFELSFKNYIEKQDYKKLSLQNISKEGLLAHFDFKNKSLMNKQNGNQNGFLNSPEGKTNANFMIGHTNEGLKLTGDAWFDTDGLGAFRMVDAFSVGLWVNIDKACKEGVIFNKTIGERLYNYKGFHVYLQKDGRLELTMAHAAPSNAITKISHLKLPKGVWNQLTMTYDGHGKAAGLKLYLNGNELVFYTEIDQLSKDINYPQMKKQPGIMVGAWWRGNGIKNALIDDLIIYNRALSYFEIQILAGKANWVQICSKEKTQLTNSDLEILKKQYTSSTFSKSNTNKNLQRLKIIMADSLEKIPELMVMQESKKPKQAYVLDRGYYDSPTVKVYPNTPEKIFKFANNLPKNRLGLAYWLVDEENPLTARVAVNRFWQNIFGVGIVKTSEDFGNQGELPSHKELLDYLSTYYVQSGWNTKKLIKLIVSSATYQQDSKASKKLMEIDSENRLLAHGPANRLTAEMIRDNALAASGLLVKKIGGKSVKPYQPAGLWEINNTTYIPDNNQDVYRRSLYVIVKRSVPHPTLATFDAPSRSYCVNRRQKTNTPLQALVTLNDPAFLEASKVIGEDMTKAENDSLGITKAYLKLTGKTPKPAELYLLLDLKKVEFEKFKKNKNKARAWLSVGYYQIDPKLDPRLVAANTVVANVILNSDACLTKR
jgi:Protein of unknown function (DUF1553)/Protein of unknown function (DUF1549)/Planctomycete cytochrome C/Concanavalin A-like lectin/glucanases superfamily